MSPLLNGLAAGWKLDETSGTRADVLGISPLAATGAVGSVSGVVDNAATFIEANTQSLSAASNANLVTGNVTYTVSFWCKINPGVVASSQGIVGKGSGGAAREFLMFWNGNRIFNRFYLSAGGQVDAITAAVVPVGGPYVHVVAGHDADVDQIFVQLNNGTLVTTSTGGSGTGTTSGPFAVGAPLNFWSNSSIDEVYFWKRRLTASEVTQLYNVGSGLTYPF